MTIDINILLDFFRLFLESNLAKLNSRIDDELIDDWLQSNWEILVESQVCKAGREFLEVYGEGADCNASSSRVWLPDALPTHRVLVVLEKDSTNLLTGSVIPKTDNEVIVFDRFVSWDGEHYSYDGPLNSLLADKSGEELLLPIEHTKFSVCPVS